MSDNAFEIKGLGDRRIVRRRTGMMSWFRAGSVEAAENARLERAFRQEERTGLMLAALVRTAVVLVIAFYVAVSSNFHGAAYAYAVGSIFGLALLGLAQYGLLRLGLNSRWSKYIFVAVDCAYLAAYMVVRNPFLNDGPPPSAVLRESDVIFFFVFLFQSAFSFSPRLVLWAGFSIVMAWTFVLLYVLTTPDVFFDAGLPTEKGLRAFAMKFANPFYVPLSKWVVEIIVIMLLAAGLSVAVSRSRKLVASASQSERARANLARHFSPNLIDTLSERDTPFGAVRRQNAAVLFADIRGFTSYAESASPDDVVDLLRGFHARAEHEVFDAGGTLDKIIGDGLMATFGTPDVGTSDATRSLVCARAMLVAFDRWNATREDVGLPQVRIGIGIHYGPVVLGDVGSERRLAFEVIGDTVNTASRLQGLSKELNVRLVVSADLVDAIRRESGSDADVLLASMSPRQDYSLRGRDAPIAAHTLA